MRRISLVHVEVNCSLPADADFAEVARSWLEGGAAFFPELFARLEAGAASGAFVDQPRGARMAQRKFSKSGWEQRLAGLGTRPLGLTLSMVDESDEHVGSVEITVIDEHAGLPGQVRLTVNARTPELLDPGSDERWMSFLADAVGSRSVDYGQVILDGNINHATSLDMAVRRIFIHSIEESSKYLRGYGWITLCPAALAARLGDGAGLEASAAFVAVRTLASGDVLLLATATPQEFDQEALRRVWRALAPVLPPGKPKVKVGYERNEVVLEDAATVERHDHL
ncbi:hypothetical protein E1263_17110 [Kribbella antibiotica]|uniref:DUF3396 domain-containing protein n=1 Tax=Kribbella antibiotica TaxID=190195 RepID=A0A4R4ZPQ9_9ACTN|nr:hypothetical protein [Kribbella antibiotica]TDD58902.1 hypothetical protein E1263_17110 [Kribbella antibiotica]